jgi:tRNA(Ile)-lysidine synthase
MRLLRGSGPAGLAGMAPRRGALLRPLLSFTRATLLGYGRARGLEWWEDPANVDDRHLRSWLRQRVLPQLEARLPDVGRRIRDAGRHAAAERRAWSAALRAWPGLEYRREAAAASVAWPVLATLEASLRMALVLAMVRGAGAVFGPVRVRASLSALAQAGSGATADLGSGWRLELAFDRLRVLPPQRPAPDEALPLSGETGEASWGGWLVRWASEAAPPSERRDGGTAWFAPGSLVIRPWRAGDRLAPLGGSGRRLAVRCFQEAKVPSSDRRGWPVLEWEGELAWIPGVCRSDRLVPPVGSAALRVDVERRG